jgi:hypothetical protein
MIAEDGRRRRTQNDLGDPLVLLDDATEDIATNNGTGPLRFASRVRRDERKSAMWPSFVVMPEVLAHHAFEMSSGDDEQVIETVFSHGPLTFPPQSGHPTCQAEPGEGSPDGTTTPAVLAGIQS